MTDPQTIAVYDGALDAYLAVPELGDHRAALDRFAAEVPPGGLVLDIGSGPGVQAAQLMARGLWVDAVDAAATFVAAARARGVTARQGVFDDLPGDKRYDGIWASFSLLHAPRDRVADHVGRLAAALTARAPFFLGMKLGTGTGRDGLGRFYSYFSLQELHDMLDKAGLHLLDTTTGQASGLAGIPDCYALILARADA